MAAEGALRWVQECWWCMLLVVHVQGLALPSQARGTPACSEAWGCMWAGPVAGTRLSIPGVVEQRRVSALVSALWSSTPSVYRARSGRTQESLAFTCSCSDAPPGERGRRTGQPATCAVQGWAASLPSWGRAPLLAPPAAQEGDTQWRPEHRAGGSGRYAGQRGTGSASSSSQGGRGEGRTGWRSPSRGGGPAQEVSYTRPAPISSVRQVAGWYRRWQMLHHATP